MISYQLSIIKTKINKKCTDRIKKHQITITNRDAKIVTDQPFLSIFLIFVKLN